MSSTIRFAIALVCGIALMNMAALEAAAQVPPGNSGRPNRGGLRSMSGDFSGKQSKKSATARFEELLEDGKLMKFRGYKQEAVGSGWKMDGKNLHFDGSGGGDIVTRDEYQDFELQFDWKISEGGNSGVMYRVSLGDNAPYFSGPEYQVLDDAKHADGKNETTSAGALYALYAPQNKKTRKAGIWNSSKIIVEGNKVVHYLNGKKVVEAEIGGDDWNKKVGESKFKDWAKFGKNSKGHIAFQDHGNEVWYRKIRVKRLNEDQAQQQASNQQQPTQQQGRAANGRARGSLRSMQSGFGNEQDKKIGGDKKKGPGSGAAAEAGLPGGGK